MRSEEGRESHFHPQPSRRRLVRKLAAPLFPDHGLQGQISPGHRHPNSPTRAWSAADDEYLQNIVSFVIEQIGKENIKAFWLVGHSQGGMTSNRIVRTDFFKDKVDGWLSLSGGAWGQPGRVGGSGPLRLRRSRSWRRVIQARPAATAGLLRPARPAVRQLPGNPAMAAAAAALREPPTNEFLAHLHDWAARNR